MQYSESGFQMEFGDIAVIGTDGIWEAANGDGKMYGKDRLREVITAHASSTSDEIKEAIIDSVREFCEDHPQLDDITVVVIKAV